jgi:hypothetical protein
VKQGDLLLEFCTCVIVLAFGCVAVRMGSKLYVFIGADRWNSLLIPDAFTFTVVLAFLCICLFAVPIFIYTAIEDCSFRKRAAERARHEQSEAGRD